MYPEQINLIVYTMMSTLCTVCVGSHSREKAIVVACVLAVG